VTVAVLLLLVNRAQHAIKVDEGWGRLLVGPGVASTIEIDLLEDQVIHDTPKAPHHAPVEVAIVLVFVFVDEVEIPSKHPGTVALGPDVLQLLEKGNFIGVFLWPIDDGEGVVVEDVAILALSAFAVNSGPETMISLLLQASKIPPRVPTAGGYM
jgi:hypothetical protein